MADRDATFDVNANDKSGPAVRSAADGFERLGDKADKAKRRIDGLGDETGELAVQMARARLAVIALGKEFDATGDKDVWKNLLGEQRKLSSLRRVSKSLELELLNGVKAVGSSPQLGAIGAAVGATMSIPIVAALTGALAAGVGSSVAGLGLLGAYLGNPEAVKSVATSTVADLKRQLVAATEDFRAPLLAVLGDVPAMVKGWGLDKAFRDAVPFVEIMADGVDGFGRGVSRGVSALTSKAQPAIEAAAAGMEELGDATGDAMEAMAEGAEGGAEALRDVLFATAALVRLTGELAGLGAKAYGWIDENPFSALLATGGLAAPIVLLSLFSDKTDQVSGRMRALVPELNAAAGAMHNTAEAAKTAAEGFNRAFGEMMNLDQASLAVKAGFTDLHKELTTGTRTLNQNTAAGQENAKGVLDQIKLIQQRYEAEIAAGSGTAEAEAKAQAAYAASIAQLRGMLTQLGYNKSEIDNLINLYEQLAKPWSATFTTVWRDVGTPRPYGYGDAKTGHSRTGAGDFMAEGGWAPAAFAASSRAGAVAFARADTAATSASRVGGPQELSATVENVVNLDGRPFREYTDRQIRLNDDRRRWRSSVGSR
jgi:hypothetical protein